MCKLSLYFASLKQIYCSDKTPPSPHPPFPQALPTFGAVAPISVKEIQIQSNEKEERNRFSVHCIHRFRENIPQKLIGIYYGCAQCQRNSCSELNQSTVIRGVRLKMLQTYQSHSALLSIFIKKVPSGHSSLFLLQQ